MLIAAGSRYIWAEQEKELKFLLFLLPVSFCKVKFVSFHSRRSIAITSKFNAPLPAKRFLLCMREMQEISFVTYCIKKKLGISLNVTLFLVD